MRYSQRRKNIPKHTVVSSPREQQLQEMFDRYLEMTVGEPARTAALTLGVDSTYIAKLRGGWRPSRVREELWQRLVAVMASASRNALREGEVSYLAQSREYYRGKQDTLMDVMRWVVDQQSQIGRYLRAADEGPARGQSVTPSVDEAEAAEAILDQLPPPAKRAPQQRRKKA